MSAEIHVIECRCRQCQPRAAQHDSDSDQVLPFVIGACIAAFVAVPGRWLFVTLCDALHPLFLP